MYFLAGDWTVARYIKRTAEAQRVQRERENNMAKFSFIRWLRLSLVISFSCLLLAGCGVNPSAGKTLRVATEPAFPPFEFQGKGGELQGFSIDLMNAIASSANFKVDFQSLPFDGIKIGRAHV